MLVITRRIGQRVLIGENITMTVSNINRSMVRLAFDAPQDVEIDREEIRKSKDKHGRRGSANHPPIEGTTR